MTFPLPQFDWKNTFMWGGSLALVFRCPTKWALILSDPSTERPVTLKVKVFASFWRLRFSPNQVVMCDPSQHGPMTHAGD